MYMHKNKSKDVYRLYKIKGQQISEMIELHYPIIQLI